jgi:hypothetical protein
MQRVVSLSLAALTAIMAILVLLLLRLWSVAPARPEAFSA